MSSLDGQTRYWQPLTIDGVTVSDNLSADYLRVDGSNSMQATLDLGGHNAAGSPFATAPGELVPLDQLQAELTGYVTTNTVQSITAQKTFTVSPLVPDATTAAQAASYGQTIHTTGANQTINSGTLSVNEGAAATIIPAITAANGTNTINFIGRASAGAYCGTVQSDDAVCWFTKGSSETGCLSIVPHAAGTKGLRITPSTVKIYSPLSVANQLISDVANAVAGTDAVNLNTLNSALSQYALDSNVIHKTGYSSETKQGQLICTYPTTGPQILTFAPIIASCQSSEIYLLPNSNPSNANPAIVSGDQAIIATGGAYDTGNVWIGVQSTNANGLRMTPTSCKFYRTLDMNSTKITSLANGSASSDAATVGQLAAYLPLTGGTITGGLTVQGAFSAQGNVTLGDAAVDVMTVNATPSFTTDVAFGTHKLTGVQDGVASSDAATVGQVNTALGNYLPLSGGTITGGLTVQGAFSAQGNVTLGDAAGDVMTVNATPSFTTDVAFGTHKLTGVQDGVATDDAATVGQVNTILGNYVTTNTVQNITAKKTFTTSQLIGTNQSLEFNANSVSSNGMNHWYDTTGAYGNIYCRGTGIRIRQRLGGSPDAVQHTKVEITQNDVQIGPGVSTGAGTYPDLSMYGGRFVGPRLPRWNSGWFAVNHNTQYNWVVTRTGDLTPSMYWAGGSTGWDQIPLEFRVLFSLTTNNPTTTYVFDVTNGSMPSNYDDHHSLAWKYDSVADAYDVNLSTGDTYVTCYRDPVAGTYQRPQSGYMKLFIY